MRSKGKNRYIKHAHVSERKLKEMLKGFSIDKQRQDVSALRHVSRNTINKLYWKFRLGILLLSSEEETFSSEIESDDTYSQRRYT